MESLPPELISRVVEHIAQIILRKDDAPVSLAPYATVDRRWQAIIERRKFSYIDINNAKRLEEFQRIDKKARAPFETDEERQRNNTIFTTTISTLFRSISGWPDDAGISLHIEAMSPSDYLALKSKALTKRGKRPGKPRVNDLLSQRYERSYLEFSRTTSDSECPPVPAITYLSIPGVGKQRLIEPASNFARNLHLFPASVRNLDLEFHNLPPGDQDYPPDVTIGPELFSPFGPQYDGIKLPFWPNLIDVSVEYTAVTPSGEWIFNWEPDEVEDDDTDDAYQSSEDDEDDYPEHLRIFVEDSKRRYFQTTNTAGYVDKFCLSAGRAALRMPKLRHMMLQTMPPRPRCTFEYKVRAGSAKLSWSNEGIRYLTYPLESDASPDEEVFQIWRKVALQHTGDELEVEFKESRT
ncbi:hypothetical protein N7519_011707 [Penicillium mononematosum]|uniref:uncharacterized protein n=1 Tax=Penicillium mononematosum TaxID=268346 RepID=UPI002547D13D|nr:uncharacterized protein N7519_011707 [Penicillium mononematosum]KAJ6181246.1 hypothetical protein N7519_011707 [Penicillium mononematosum]